MPIYQSSLYSSRRKRKAGHFRVVFSKGSWTLQSSHQQSQLDSSEQLLFLHSLVYTVITYITGLIFYFTVYIASHFSHSFYFIFHVQFFVYFLFTSYQVIFNIINHWNNYRCITLRARVPNTSAFSRDYNYYYDIQLLLNALWWKGIGWGNSKYLYTEKRGC